MNMSKLTMMISFPVVNDAKKFIEKLNPKN